jgi:hypothetical protein
MGRDVSDDLHVDRNRALVQDVGAVIIHENQP